MDRNPRPISEQYLANLTMLHELVVAAELDHVMSTSIDHERCFLGEYNMRWGSGYDRGEVVECPRRVWAAVSSLGLLAWQWRWWYLRWPCWATLRSFDVEDRVWSVECKVYVHRGARS